VAQLLVAPPIRYATARALHDGMLAQIAAGLPAAAIAIAATAAAIGVPRLLGEPSSPWSLMAERLAVGGAVYVPAVALLLRAHLAQALRSMGVRRRPA
jgi:hypothetical protein